MTYLQMAWKRLEERAERAEARIAELAAASLRSDEVHAEAIRAVRGRAERAEARAEELEDAIRKSANQQEKP